MKIIVHNKVNNKENHNLVEKDEQFLQIQNLNTIRLLIKYFEDYLFLVFLIYRILILHHNNHDVGA